MARIGLVVENQESESSLEGYPAKRWLEDRTHSIKPKQRELRTRCSWTQSSGVEEQEGALEGSHRQPGDACGDFKSFPCTSLNMLSRSFKRIMVDGQIALISFIVQLKS